MRVKLPGRLSREVDARTHATDQLRHLLTWLALTWLALTWLALTWLALTCLDLS